MVNSIGDQPNVSEVNHSSEQMPAAVDSRCTEDWFALSNLLLRQREIGRGLRLLEDTEPVWRSLQVPERPAADVLLLLGQWVDVGYRDAVFLRSMLDLLPPSRRFMLSVREFVRVQMVEAFYSLAVDDADGTIRTLDVLLRLDQELLDADLKILAHLWKGRAHRKKAEYGAASEHIRAARDLAAAQAHVVVVAVIQVQLGWLVFQNGDVADALRVFDEAERVLEGTDHWIALGNIASARGRIVRRGGDYVLSLHHFERAIDFYERRNPNHQNLARAVTNHAFVKRLLALQLKKHIDSCASHRGQKHAGSSRDGTRLRPLYKQYQELYQSALVELERAKQICALGDHHTGYAAALLNAGQLHLDGGELELAGREASQAYEIADRISSVVFKARARILGGLVENTHVEELLGHPEDAPGFARRAKQYCAEALALAQTVQNKRLLLNAHIASGEVNANNFFRDYDLARRSTDAASALLEPGDGDYVVEDLNALKARLLQTVGIDDTLRGWSKGIVGDKTLQEVTEQFAELVVKQVWLRQGRRISRVAKTLSVSPKKVRRLLKHADLSAVVEGPDTD